MQVMSRSAFVAAVVESPGASRISLADPPVDSGQRRGGREHRVFQIESAHASLRRQAANHLLRERYAWRGYHSVSLPEGLSGSHFSLCATQDGKTIGTMTVGFENPYVLNCEDEFSHEVHTLRTSGLRLCEFTRLAIDPAAGSKAVLAALFHVAYIVAHRLRGVDTLLMEVNPRHVRYYQRMLGAHVFGSERMNTKVNAPAVLLRIDFAHVKSQIAAFSGRPAGASTERSLYSLAFSPVEEEGIMARLTNTESQPPSVGQRRFTFRLPIWRRWGFLGA